MVQPVQDQVPIHGPVQRSLPEVLDPASEEAGSSKAGSGRPEIQRIHPALTFVGEEGALRWPCSSAASLTEAASAARSASSTYSCSTSFTLARPICGLRYRRLPLQLPGLPEGVQVRCRSESPQTGRSWYKGLLEALSEYAQSDETGRSSPGTFIRSFSWTRWFSWSSTSSLYQTSSIKPDDPSSGSASADSSVPSTASNTRPYSASTRTRSNAY